LPDSLGRLDNSDLTSETDVMQFAELLIAVDESVLYTTLSVLKSAGILNPFKYFLSSLSIKAKSEPSVIPS